MREHLEKVSQIPGAPRPADLDQEVDPPAIYLHLWHNFWSLNGGRQYDNDGHPQPSSHQEIFAWCSLYAERLTRGELALLRRLDITFINITNQLYREHA